MKEIDENDVEQVKNDNTIDIALYQNLKGQKDSFLNYTGTNHDTVSNMLFALNHIASKYEEMSESKNKLSDEEAIKEKERVAGMYPKIKKFTKAVKDLQEAAYQTYGEDDPEIIQQTLNTIAAFHSFLVDGEGTTNFNKILTDISN